MPAPDVTTPRAEQPGDTTTTTTSPRKEADTTNDLRGGQADDAALADLIDYLEACCDDSTQGWLHVGVWHGPHLNDQ
ncbi:MAG TPA: hypothetical protein VHU91_03425 [Mycobacteriales bacterium]|nr:hypothetical protein [Mycobacteriales bacterium]